MSAIKSIKKEINRKVSAVTSVNKVYDYEKINPTGFPAACITYAGMENEFFTNAENKRVYVYRIFVMVRISESEASSTSDQVEIGEQQIQDITADVIDAIDDDYTLGGDDAEILFVEAAVGEPGYIQTEGGWCRTSEITVRVHSLFLV